MRVKRVWRYLGRSRMKERWIMSKEEKEHGGRKGRGGEGIVVMKRHSHGDSRGEELSGRRDDFYPEYRNLY
jgi:hypothetical protein